jgi:hypothetical protein
MNTKYKLIKIDYSYLLTSNEEIKEGDYYYEPTSEQPFSIAWKDFESKYYQSKIIARFGIPLTHVSVIDFSSLSKQECKTIGYIDIKKLAKESYPYKPTLTWENQTDGFKQGFLTAQRLMGFSVTDLSYYLEFVENNFYYSDAWYNRDTDEPAPRTEILQAFINSRNKVTEWNVEIEHSIINDDVKIIEINPT